MKLGKLFLAARLTPGPDRAARGRPAQAASWDSGHTCRAELNLNQAVAAFAEQEVHRTVRPAEPDDGLPAEDIRQRHFARVGAMSARRLWRTEVLEESDIVLSDLEAVLSALAADAARR